MKKLSSVKAKLALVPALVLAASQSAFAALPTSVSDTATKAGADAQSIFDLVFPVIGTVLSLTIVIKLFKRFVAKV